MDRSTAMWSLRVFAVLVTLTLAPLESAQAARSIDSVTLDPPIVVAGTPTEVRVKALIEDDTLLPGGAVLQRLNDNGTVTSLGVMHDDAVNGDQVAGDRIFTFRLSVNQAVPGILRLRVSAVFRGLARRIFSPEIDLTIGVPVAPNQGITILGGGGTSFTIQPQTVNVPVLAGASTTPLERILAPTGNLGLATAISIVFQPTDQTGLFAGPTQPLSLAVPASSDTAEGTEFIVAQQRLVDTPQGTLVPQLVATATAVATGGAITTTSGPLAGIQAGGTFAVVKATGSGFVTGVVSSAAGPEAGVIVSSNTNPLVALTDGDGRYTLFVSGGPFTVTAFHPLKTLTGSASGTIENHNDTVQADISVAAPAAPPPPTRAGIRNGGFERCNLTGWQTSGSVSIVEQFGPTSTGVVIRPTEGKCMADLSTGAGAGSNLRQTFIVPAGVRGLSVDFNFISDEFDEWVGSVFSDTFQAIVITPTGQRVLASVQVNDYVDNTGGFTNIGNCTLPDGDDTCAQTGWRTAVVDLSPFAGLATPVTVELVFAVTNAGDTYNPTHVLIDNIRFGTVWVDAKIMSGANADAARVARDIAFATEVLSQVGLNVRLRNLTTIADPGGLLDLDTTWSVAPGTCPQPFQVNGVMPAEIVQLMGLARSGTPSDVNVYYVRAATRPVNGVTTVVRIAGYSINPDEYCNAVEPFLNSGLIITNLGNTATVPVLAHELGHLLISPEGFANALEHAVADTANIMVPVNPSATGTLSRIQSVDLGRINSPFVVQ
jgi:hypothetical protein